MGLSLSTPVTLRFRSPPVSADMPKNFSLKYMLFATAVSGLLRGVFGLRDVFVPVELSIGLGPTAFVLGVQDMLVGLVAGFVAGKRIVSGPVAQDAEHPEAELVRRYERAYRIFRNCGLLVFGLSVLGGVAIVGTGIQSVRNGLNTRNWQRVEGIILDSKVNSTSRTERMAYDSNRPDEITTRTRDTFFPDIKYEYEVDCRKREGTQITVSDAGMASEQASAQTKQFPTGLKATIYDDPAEPTRSVLVPGVASTSILTIVVGCLWNLCCFFAIKFLILSNFSKRMVLEFVKPTGGQFSDSRVIRADNDDIS